MECLVSPAFIIWVAVASVVESRTLSHSSKDAFSAASKSTLEVFEAAFKRLGCPFAPEQKLIWASAMWAMSCFEGPHIGCWPKIVVLGRHSIGRFEKITLSDCIELLQFGNEGIRRLPKNVRRSEQATYHDPIMLHAGLPGSMVTISQRDGKHALPACRLSFACHLGAKPIIAGIG